MAESSKAYQKNIEEADRLLKTLAELTHTIRTSPLSSPKSPSRQFFDAQTPAKELEPENPDDFLEPQPSSSTPQPHTQYGSRPPPISPSPSSRVKNTSQRPSAGSSRSTSPTTPYSPSIEAMQQSPNKMSPGHEERLKNYHMYKDKIGRNSAETRELRDRYRHLEKTVRELSNQLRAASKNNEKLQLKLEKDAKERNENNNSLHILKESHMAELQELNELLNQYQQQLQTKQKEVDTSAQKIKEFEKRLSQAEKSQLNRSKSDEMKLQRLSLELEEREETIQAQSLEIDNLKKAIEDVEAREGNLNDIKKQLKEQKETNRKLQQDNRLFNRTVKELQSQHDIMHSTLQSSNDENNRLKERISKLKSEHAGLYETNNQISEQVEHLRESMKDENEKLKHENENLQSELDQLEDQLQTAHQSNTKLQNELNEKGQAIEKLKRQIHQLETKLIDYEGEEARFTSEEMEALKLTTNELELENQSLNIKVESMQMELAKAKKQYTTIQKELSKTNDTISNTLTPRTKMLENELRVKEEAYDRLYEDFVTKEDEVADLNQLLEDAHMKSSMSKEAFTKTENLVNNQESTIDTLRERVSQLELESASMREVNAQLSFSLKNKKEEVATLKEKLDNLPTLGDEMQEFKQKYMALMDKRDDLQEKYDQMVANNHHFKKSTGEKMDTLEHVNQLLTNQVKKMKKVLENKQENLDAVTREAIDNSHYRQSLQIAEKERDQSQNHCDSLEEKLRTREQHVESLQAELLALQTEFHDFKQESSDSIYRVEELEKLNRALQQQLVQQRSDANDNFYETINNVKKNETDLMASRKHIISLETRIRSQEELIQDLEKRCSRINTDSQVKVNRERDRIHELEKDVHRARELVDRIKEAKKVDRIMYEEKIDDLERRVRHLNTTNANSEAMVVSPSRREDHKEELHQLAASYELRLRAAADQKRLDDAQIETLQRKLADMQLDITYNRSDLFNSTIASPLRTLTPSRPYSSPSKNNNMFRAPDLSNY